MEHGRFRNWLSHYPEATLIIACKDGRGYQLCVEAEEACLCLTDSQGERLTFTSLDQALGFLRIHQLHQARLRIYDAENEEDDSAGQDIMIKF